MAKNNLQGLCKLLEAANVDATDPKLTPELINAIGKDCACKVTHLLRDANEAAGFTDAIKRAEARKEKCDD